MAEENKKIEEVATEIKEETPVKKEEILEKEDFFAAHW